MNWWQALVLGLVEGITEYLPVSSTGHLLLAQRLMGIGQSEAADAFAICIQAGAIVAVLGLYRRHVWQMLQGVLGRNPAGLRLLTNIVTAFLPALACGAVFEKLVKKYLFGGQEWGLWPIIAAWLVGGIAILAVAWRRRARSPANETGYTIEELTWKMALVIGASQCIAMWPGTSRSLVTIVGGMLVGLRMSAAVEFSFLLGVLTLTAATAKDAVEHGSEIVAAYGATEIVLGFLAAWVSAVLAVKWMVSYLNRHGLGIFGYYRIALAIVVAALVWFGAMSSHAVH
jgi:undecaprenyl-diphosphatase